MRYPASLRGWSSAWEFRMACSMESMRKYNAPSRRASSRAMVVFPAPGSPPKIISNLPHVRGIDRLLRPRRRIFDVRHNIGQLLARDLVLGRRVLPHIVAAHRCDIRWRDFLLLRGILRKIE